MKFDAKEVDAILGELVRRRQADKLANYEPYPFQVAFHNARGEKTTLPAAQKALMAGNQCLGPETLVYGETIRSRFLKGSSFEVEALTRSGDRVVTKARPPVRKSAEPVFRVQMADGSWFDCSDGHRILTDVGYASFGSLRQFLPCRPLSSSALCLPTHAEGGRHWSRRQPGYQDGYSWGSHPCDERPHFWPGIAQALFPSPADVLAHSRISFSSDGSVGIDRDIAPTSLGPLAISDGLPQNAVLFFESLARAWHRLSPRTKGLLSVFLRTLSGSRLHPQSAYGFLAPSEAVFDAQNGPWITSLDGNEVVSYSYIGIHNIYDFHVPVYNNYLLNDLSHLQTGKTVCGCHEDAYHATGLYPEWWEGYRFGGPVQIMVATHTNELVRDRLQDELCGDPLDEEALGTGALPGRCIGKTVNKPGIPAAIDSVLVRHHTKGKMDGWSRIVFKAYEQGPKKFQAKGYHVLHMDEEPPFDIWSQCLRAIIATRGLIMLTFTPEHGVTEIVDSFLNDIKTGQALVRATWDDAPHIRDNPEHRSQLEGSMREYERDKRTKGIPEMGTGLIFNVPDDRITFDAADFRRIPSYWPRIAGIDLGFDHPFAAVWLAWDRDTDTVYLYDCMKEKGLLLPVMADVLKRHEPWIPIAWPHDVGERDRESGKRIADVLRDDYGVNMLPEAFTNPPGPGEDEGEGGRGVETGLWNMHSAMEEGRFRVAKHLVAWFREKGLYHRKDGKVVRKFDDLMSATRYAFQSLRFADVAPTPKRRAVKRAVGMRNW